MIGYMLGGKLFNLIINFKNFKKIINYKLYIINYKLLILFFFVKISYCIVIDFIVIDLIFNDLILVS